MPEKKLFELFLEAMKQNKELSQKQKRVLKSSLELFATQGFDRTSTADIAQKAEVSQGTVYKQFKTKQSLLINGLAPIIKEALDDAIKDFEREKFQTNPLTLDAFLHTIVFDRSRFLENNILAEKVIFDQILVNQEFSLLIKDFFFKKILALLGPKLDFLKKKNELIDLPNEKIFSFIFTNVVGPIILNDHPRSNEELEDTYQILLRSLKKKSDQTGVF